MTDIATWPFSMDSEYGGKGIGFFPVTATVERRTDWGYSFEEDPEQNERGYKRTWSGPRGKWNDSLRDGRGGSEPYTGATYEPGTKVRVGLAQRDGISPKTKLPTTYHNLLFISPVEPDAGGAGGPAAQMGVRQPEAAATQSETPTAPVQDATAPMPLDVRIGLGAAGHDLVALLCAPKTSPATKTLEHIQAIWAGECSGECDKEPIFVMAHWVAQRAEGAGQALVIPDVFGEPESPAEEDASEVVEQADSHLSDVPDEDEERLPF